MTQLALWLPEESEPTFTNVRKEWHDGEWVFSIVDVIAILLGLDHQKARKYWNKLAQRLRDEGADQLVTDPYQLSIDDDDDELSDICGQLGMPSDGEVDQPVTNCHHLKQQDKSDDVSANIGHIKTVSDEGSELSANIGQLKLRAEDGKMRLADVATTEQMLRIIQSIPSPRAEPFKRWLAQVGRERIEETANPELGVSRAVDRATQRYLKMGRDDQWMDARFNGMISRRAFTDALIQAVQQGLADGQLFGQATGDLYKGVFHLNTQQLRKVMHLEQRANLRDNLPRVALHFLAIAEDLCAQELGQAQQLTPEQARALIKDIAGVVGASAQYLQDHIHTNLLTDGA